MSLKYEPASGRDRIGAAPGAEVGPDVSGRPPGPSREREFFIDNLLVRIHFIIVMIRWTGPST